MKDIADALGVSVVTVSKVLNGKKHISEETAKRVHACAERLGYRTNLAARGLKTGRSRIIGLIVPDLMHGFFAEVAASLMDALRDDGYGLVISSSRDDSSLEREEIRQMVARNVDALVIASCQIRSPILRTLAFETPIVFFDRKISDVRNSAFVGTNNPQAGTLATEYLVSCGYKRIAYVGGSRLSPNTGRQAGYRSALKNAGLDIDKSLVLSLTQKEESSPQIAYEAMKQRLAENNVPDGVVCYNDMIAYGVVKAALEAGMKIPQDMGVVGFGNLRLNEFLRVPLTSIDQNTMVLGTECALAAKNLITAQDHSVSGHISELLVPARLIIGKSTRKSRP